MPMTAAERRNLADPKCPPKLLRARIAELEAEVARLGTGSGHPKGWTEAEDAIVRNGYGRHYRLATIRAELIARGHRSRSFGGISGRAQHLGCSSVFAPNVWTAGEDAILQTGYAEGVTCAEIRRRLLAAGFLRNRVAIGMRAIALGISGERTNPWSEGETAIAVSGLRAGKLFREIEADLARSGFERSKGSLTKFARKHGLSRPAQAWSDDEVDHLRRRYAERAAVATIARELGKSSRAITSKASALGVKQREPRRRASGAVKDLTFLEAGNEGVIAARLTGPRECRETGR